jgi:hypothetical protein
VNRTHSLLEATEAVCGETSPQAIRWMADRLRDRRFSGRKIRGHWRLTDSDIEFALDVCANGAVREEVSGPRVLSFAPTSARRRAS